MWHPLISKRMRARPRLQTLACLVLLACGLALLAMLYGLAAFAASRVVGGCTCTEREAPLLEDLLKLRDPERMPAGRNNMPQPYGRLPGASHAPLADIQQRQEEIEREGWNALLFPEIEHVADPGELDHRRRQRPSIPCGMWNASSQLVMRPNTSEFSYCEIVVLTAIIGDQDRLQRQHQKIPSPASVCFIAFLDRVTIQQQLAEGALQAAPGGGYQGGAWHVIELLRLPYADPRKNSRIFKHLAPVLFPQALFSIWVDSKYELLLDPLDAVLTYAVKPRADLTFVHHPVRARVADEAAAVVGHGLAPAAAVAAQLHTYGARGFQPETFTGQVDGTWIIRNHRVPASLAVSCAWFNEIDRYTPRDQLSFNYVLHRLGYAPVGRNETELREAAAAGCLQAGGLDYFSPLLGALGSRVHVVGNACERKRILLRLGHKRRHGVKDAATDGGGRLHIALSKIAWRVQVMWHRAVAP